MNEKVNNDINLDSLLLRIPLTRVEVLNKELTDKHQDYTVNESTGEFTLKKHRYKPSEFEKLEVKKIGYKFEFKVKSLINNYTGKKTKYLYMLVNAKMLETKYLEGITFNNVRLIYNRLIACKVAKFSYSTFLDYSKCTNIEYCKNFRMVNLKEQLINLKDKIVKTPKRLKNPVPRLTKNAKEISLRFRDKDGSTNAKPHIFIYQKEKELLSNSYQFEREYLQDSNIKDLCRIEFRIKDKGHCEHLSIKDNSLKSLLTLSNDEKEVILNRFTMSYLELPKPKTNNKKLNTNDEMMLTWLRSLVKDSNFGTASEIMLQDITSRSSKSKKYKQLKQLYNDHLRILKDNPKTEAEIYDLLSLFHEA